jgi:hypothetical protein
MTSPAIKPVDWVSLIDDNNYDVHELQMVHDDDETVDRVCHHDSIQRYILSVCDRATCATATMHLLCKQCAINMYIASVRVERHVE